MEANIRLVARRFMVDWGEMDTLADPEQIVADIHAEGDDQIVIVELCAEVVAGNKGVRPAWARKVYIRGQEVEVRKCDPRIAEVFIKSALRRVTMIRYRQIVGGLEWAINRFTADNEGLSLAEVFVPADSRELSLPIWVKPDGEVTGNPNFSLFGLATTPWTKR